MPIACTDCGAEFRGPFHMERHRGTARCQLNIARSNVGGKAVAANRVKNSKRRVMSTIGGFVEYLKSNVAACIACIGECGLDFVPFASH